ncbi:Hpt domain-containing protein [Roseivivax sediminis]|uniref:Hpt domain-containing protein n=1 Tax=Roseivivax sediminis TaxID=936889 RepID=A0A1I1UKQ5_9RHOB|nr:Hpt domain-containing protein [Roseivivax sediminis]SFD69333.1 Hpt domain-containing protein [Roseivivax sediminis]
MIDWHQVDQLRDEIGPDDFAEVAGVFLREVDRTLAGLDSRSTELAAALHFLKGSALNLGMSGLARLCAEGEAAARAGRPVPDPGRLRPVFDASRAALERGLAERYTAA